VAVTENLGVVCVPAETRTQYPIPKYKPEVLPLLSFRSSTAMLVEWGGVELNLRPTVSRPVSLGVGPHPLGPMTRLYMFFSLTCTCFFLYCALSDERTGLYFAVHITHWSESRRTHNHTLLSHLRLGPRSTPLTTCRVTVEVL
jgi:hypothetical protein